MLSLWVQFYHHSLHGAEWTEVAGYFACMKTGQFISRKINYYTFITSGPEVLVVRKGGRPYCSQSVTGKRHLFDNFIDAL
jgi:hypothetical protein